MPWSLAEFLDRAGVAHVVLDPVMKSTSGETDLLDAGGMKYISRRIDEARDGGDAEYRRSRNSFRNSRSRITPAMEAAARKIVERGARAVVVKGGHMEKAIDVLFDGDEVLTLGGDHVKTENTHGSGCTFASAIAAQLACGRPLREAVLLAKAYVTKAIEKGLPSAKAPARSIISTASTRNRPRAASTKFRSTACTPPPNPPRARSKLPQMHTMTRRQIVRQNSHVLLDFSAFHPCHLCASWLVAR